MKHISFRFGSLAGAIIIGSIILGDALTDNTSEHLADLEWLGYLVMIAALSLIFVGIKRHRDQELGGVIRFGTAALVGLGITVVASVIYVVAWEIYLSITDYAFIEDYTRSVLASMEAKGVSGAALQSEIESMNILKEQYANPFYRLPLTFLEIFPVGVVISLISAVVLRNSKVLPADAS